MIRFSGVTVFMSWFFPVDTNYTEDHADNVLFRQDGIDKIGDCILPPDHIERLADLETEYEDL